jgi:hypothetical protein
VLAIPGFADVLRFEAASVEAAADGRTVRVALTQDVGALLGDIADGRIPATSSDQATVLDIGVAPQPFVRLVGSTPAEAPHR